MHETSIWHQPKVLVWNHVSQRLGAQSKLATFLSQSACNPVKPLVEEDSSRCNPKIRALAGCAPLIKYNKHEIAGNYDPSQAWGANCIFYFGYYLIGGYPKISFLFKKNTTRYFRSNYKKVLHTTLLTLVTSLWKW